MPKTPFEAFVSSTYEDLKDYRGHVINALRKAGISVDPMEDWAAESDEPKKFSQERLAGCDFCVLLVAFRRGYIPKGENRSITQLEYQAALDRKIDILVYLLDENSPWQRRFDELERDPGLTEWRRSLEESHGRKLFGFAPSSIEIAPAITRWVEKQSLKATKVSDDWLQLVSNLLNLPPNEPETWAVAKALLPHALDAVQRAYSDNPAAKPSVKLAEPSARSEMSQPIRTLLAGAQEYFEDSRARYERTCFVVMPYGKKVVGDREIDFDSIYEQIFEPAINGVALPAPENGTLLARRFDDSADPTREMYNYLEYSRFVLADITGGNALVLYSLGHRHRARASGTAVFLQPQALILFDITRIRTFEYRCARLDETEASRQLVRKVIEDCLLHQPLDSPAHLVLGSTTAEKARSVVR